MQNVPASERQDRDPKEMAEGGIDLSSSQSIEKQTRR